jgi:hypothetical protein
MTYLTVSGAYGRDYNSKAAALADWNADKDFVVRSINGSGYINKTDAIAAGVKVNIRYKRDTMITPAPTK